MAPTRIVASLDSRALSDALVRALPAEVSCLRVHAAADHEPDPAALRRAFSGDLAYALDPLVALADTDGAATATRSGAERRACLQQAAAYYDLVELDVERDLDPETLSAIAPEKRLICWRGAPTGATELRRRFEAMAEVPACHYRLVPRADRVGEALAPLELLHGLGRDDVTAFASGRAGVFSQLLAPFFGSALVHGAAAAGEQPDELLAVDRLIVDYGLPASTCRLERLYGIVGNPVLRSLSPRLHNAAYRALGTASLFVPFHAPSFAEFWDDLGAGAALRRLDIELGGLTVASPHKEAVLALADESCPAAWGAGAANLFVPVAAGWRASTTDASGTLELLRLHGVEAGGRTAAVVGCGGSGRAIALALEGAGWQVVLVNRGAARGALAHSLLHLPFVPLTDFHSNGHSIIVNATPVGAGQTAGRMPFDIAGLSPGAVVIDLPYGEQTTPLIDAARAGGHLAIDGRQMLLAQVPQQFELMTGTPIPAGVADLALGGR